MGRTLNKEAPMPEERRSDRDQEERGRGSGDVTMREAGQLGGREVQRQRDLRDRKEVRGEAYDKPGPPEGTAYGIAAITQALEGLEFPATKDDVLKKAGRKTIEYRKGEEVDLREIIEAVDEEEFPSMANIVEAVSEALREEGISGGEERSERAA
jgi:hypothetical protein